MEHSVSTAIITHSTLLKLNLDQIRCYERNPRKFGNPEYHNIKESIRLRGLEQKLVVTQRPGDELYGGGTRFAILRDLWHETQDPRFFEQECLFEPYASEQDLYISHGIENLKRAQMNFIETAFFYWELKQIYEHEIGQMLSIREVCERIRQEGFSIDPPRLTRYQYAVGLYQHIPKAFEAGLARPLLDELRKLERTYKEIWQRNSEEDSRFERLFEQALMQCDEACLDISRVQTTLERLVADGLNLDQRHLGSEADLLLHCSEDEAQTVAKTMSLAQIMPVNAPEIPVLATLDVNQPALQQQPESGAIETSKKEEWPNLLLAPDLPDNAAPENDSTDARLAQADAEYPPLKNPFNACRAVVLWCEIIAGFFPEMQAVLEDGTMVDLENESSLRITLRNIPRQLDGKRLVDFVWWRMWRAIEGPYLAQEEDALQRTLDSVTHQFADRDRFFVIATQSHWLFNDPAYAWIHLKLNALESAIRRFHLIKVMHT